MNFPESPTVGDVQGYWTLMSEHSGYAKLAGEVASGKGVNAYIANARLQRDAIEQC